MRSSKSRSRSNPNRPRTLGNIVNRVFDSSGPDGKVRGTPAQLIEKYQFLARDAQLGNDRVAAENFLQHAEHYTRMLAEAMREMAAEQESRQQYGQQGGNQNNNQTGSPNNNQNSNQNNNQNVPYARNTGGNSGGNAGNAGGNTGGNSGGNSGNQNPQRDRNQSDRGERREDYRPDYRADYREEGSEQPVVSGHDMIEALGDGDAGLVETPEAQRNQRQNEQQRRPDRPRNEQSRNEQSRNEQPRRPYPPQVAQHRVEGQPETPVSASAEPVLAPMMPTMPAPVEVARDSAAPAAKPRRSRAPRKPAEGEAASDTGAQDKAAG